MNPFPQWINPMLATLTQERFSRPDWVFEPKLDGVRCIAYSHKGSLSLFSRNQLKMNETYSNLGSALGGQKTKNFIVDGEIVAFKPGSTVSSFSALQQRMGKSNRADALRSGVPVFYYVFDLLFWDKQRLTALPLLQRKGILEKEFRFNDQIRYVSALPEAGEDYFKEACRQGWEGLIAKQTESPYISGRSDRWLKFKCVNEEEFVIGGFTDPERSRIEFGALLLGYYDKGKLIYAGKVGTGYTQETLRLLGKKLKTLQQPTCPFAKIDLPRKGLHWVSPQLVAQVRFSEWTEDGKARHPSFLGLRSDKPASEVHRA